MESKFRFEVTLTLAAPVLSQASGGRKLGVDSAVQRDPDNRPALLGTLVRGNLRHAWNTLAALVPDCKPPVDDWLGDPSPDGKDDAPNRGRLEFDRYWAAEHTGLSAVRHRIAIDRQRGSVRQGALQVIESPFGAGEEVKFTGAITARLTAAEAENLEFWLRKGLAFVPALGGLKGAGFGRLLAVQVSREKLDTTVEDRSDAGPVRFGIRLTLDRPFCFSKPHQGRSDNNRFESEEFIPGGALKGALARQLGLPKALGESPLADCFAKIRFTHAYPALAALDAHRPLSPPLSLVADSGDRLRDLALLSGPGLIGGAAPSFQPDWKGRHWGSANDQCGWPALERSLTIHNAIDAATRRTRDEALFSIEAIDPRDRVWLAQVDLSAVPESQRSKVGSELRARLRGGIERLGKTEACAEVALIDEGIAPKLPQRAELLVERRAVVTLLSAALLTPTPGPLPPTNGGDAMRQAYADAWARLSGGALALSHFYARQTLVGGGYLWRRFWGGPKAGPYNPWLLTEAGSVFVLAVVDGGEEEAKRCLDEWRQAGLPQVEEALNDWQRNPYLRENGYGEVAVNLKLHWDLRPGKGEWHELAFD